MPAPRKLPVKNERQFECSFCKRAFVREDSFMVHMCANKTKWLNRDEKYVKLGFYVYQRFHKLMMQGKKERDYSDFMASRFYNDFTRFGRYLLHINAINAESFVDFLIKTGLPIKEWTSPRVYETYIRELTKRETYDVALERNFLLMQQWAQQTAEPWQDFFRKVSPALATHYVRSGRLSPWLLYTAQSAEELLKRMSPEQLELVFEYADPDFWQQKFDKHADDVVRIKKALEEADI